MQTSVNQEHGPNRSAVVETQATACSETTLRRSRSTLARYASRAERCSLGFAHGCSLARSARPLSTLPNLPSPLFDQRLRQKHGIRLIAPHKYNRRRKSTQDGRELRRYCRRWKIERLFAWLHNFRRLVSRWEYHEGKFLGMLQLGCLIILLRHL